jgi:hypothetical protein
MSEKAKLVYARIAPESNLGLQSATASTSGPTKTMTNGDLRNQEQVADLAERFSNMKDEFRALIDVENEMDEEEKGDGGPSKEARAAEKQRGREELTFEIAPEMIEQVKEQCIKHNYPLIEEYDFKRDND